MLDHGPLITIFMSKSFRGNKNVDSLINKSLIKISLSELELSTWERFRSRVTSVWKYLSMLKGLNFIVRISRIVCDSNDSWISIIIAIRHWNFVLDAKQCNQFLVLRYQHDFLRPQLPCFSLDWFCQSLSSRSAHENFWCEIDFWRLIKSLTSLAASTGSMESDELEAGLEFLVLYLCSPFSSSLLACWETKAEWKVTST